MSDALHDRMARLRARLDGVFAADTSALPEYWTPRLPSTGHCAVVAMLINERYGGEYLSTSVSGLSHWFNRIRFGGEWFDVDITGDQFLVVDLVQVTPPRVLWNRHGVRVRSCLDLNDATRARFSLLRDRLLAVETVQPWSAR